MTDITALIITKNEEKNIVECIKSISNFASRILVIDSGSDDRTQEVARNLGAEVYFHAFETHARQRNWALENLNIKTKWILRLDADERFTPALCKELEEKMTIHENDDVNGFVLEAWLYFMGKCLKYGGSRKKKLMVFKTGKGYIEDRKMDEHTLLTEGRAEEIKEKFLHYDFKDLTTYINKLNWYATREMQDYFLDKESAKSFQGENGEISRTRKLKFGLYYRFPMFIRAWMLFIFNYYFKGGFLNGKEGYIYTYLYSRFYRTLVDAKIYEQMKFSKEFEKMEDLKS